MDEFTNKSEADADSLEPAEKKKRSDLFGQNFLGITYIAPDFDENLPLEFWLDEDFPLESDARELDQRKSTSSTSME